MVSMTRPLPNTYPLTAPFYEQRGNHVHGAIDIGAPTSTTIKAPEGGIAFAWAAYRTADGQYWPTTPTINGAPFTWRNYFYDMYGGVIVLVNEAKTRTHIITHTFGNQIFNQTFIGVKRYYAEEKEDKRFPIHAFYTDIKPIKEGQFIGYVGNSGKTTGPHIHWEIHNGLVYNDHEKRINPEDRVSNVVRSNRLNRN